MFLFGVYGLGSKDTDTMAVKKRVLGAILRVIKQFKLGDDAEVNLHDNVQVVKAVSGPTVDKAVSGPTVDKPSLLIIYSDRLEADLVILALRAEKLGIRIYGCRLEIFMSESDMATE
ncbi:MAG: hypothetical protein WCV71_04205 [Patescibacteria group bacterium]